MRKAAGNRQLILRIPTDLNAKLVKDAARKKVTAQAVILSILADHYGVTVPKPSRGRPKMSSE